MCKLVIIFLENNLTVGISILVFLIDFEPEISVLVIYTERIFAHQ